MTDPPPFDLDDVLGYLIARVAAELQHGFTDLMAAEGLTVRQFGILTHVGRQDGLGSAELARRLDITPQSMGDQVDTLVRRGLLHRDPDPGPGRKVGLHLTAAGGEALGRAGRLAGEFERRTTGHLDADQRAQLAAMLTSILEQVRPPRP